jgi:hypothetical protein
MTEQVQQATEGSRKEWEIKISPYLRSIFEGMHQRIVFNRNWM